ncbi:MAG TPA: hypothetical protein VLG49_02150 [Rhabdochlamydiaceae bacterium]|nr:hypothetical protein [Rhabdochlamydiaceae bacterium]
MSILINKNFNLSFFSVPLKQRDINSFVFFRKFSDKKQSNDFTLIIAGKNARPYGESYAHAETADTIEQIDNSLERASFNSKNISILTHAQVNLFAKEPKFSSLIKGKPEIFHTELTELSKTAKKGDRLWIFLIGHGLPLSEKKLGLISDYSEKEKQVISPKDIRDSCRIVPEGIDINIIADCCHSGIFVPLTSKNTLVFCSSNAEKRSNTTFIGERYSTVFAEEYSKLAVDTTPSLLKAHLRSIDPEDKPGYDSYSYVLCNLIARRILTTSAIDLNGYGLAGYRYLDGKEIDPQNKILTKVNKIIYKEASKWKERPIYWYYSCLPTANERFTRIANPEETEALEMVAKRML